MRFLEFVRRGGRCGVAAIAAGRGWFGRAAGLTSLAFVGSMCAPVCRTCSTLELREVGGRWSAPPGRSKGVFDDAAASVPRIILLSLLNPTRD